MRRIGILLATFLAFASGHADAASICDPQVIAQLKNLSEQHESKTVEDTLYNSFCSKQENTSLSLPTGSESGQVSFGMTVTKACLTNSKRFFQEAKSDYLVSTLPESVQKELVYACGPGGLQFVGSDNSGTLTLTARYARLSDGSTAVHKLNVLKLVVVSDDNKEVTCQGLLATKDISISDDGISATCPRSGNDRPLIAELDAVDDGGKAIGATISFAGKTIEMIKWAGPNVAGTDGNWFYCSGNDGAYRPSPNYSCRAYDACDSTLKRVSKCAAWWGTNFEIGPADGVWIQWRDSYSKHEKAKTEADCLPKFSSKEDDICVTRREIVRGSDSVRGDQKLWLIEQQSRESEVTYEGTE